MLHAGLRREGKEVSSFEALNDVCVSKATLRAWASSLWNWTGKRWRDFGRRCDCIHTDRVNGVYAGRNGDSEPDVDAMVVTPICPHLLTLRPIVVRATPALLCGWWGFPTRPVDGDGQQAVELQRGDEVVWAASNIR